MPVSAEQEDGPKKVKAFLSGFMMAVSALPHRIELPDLKLHCDSPDPVMVKQGEQNGNSLLTTGPGSVSLIAIRRPSILNSFLQLIKMSNKRKSERKAGFPIKC